jgi:hypothetical protein
MCVWINIQHQVDANEANFAAWSRTPERDAEGYINISVFSLLGFFQPTTSPPPGMHLSKLVACPSHLNLTTHLDQPEADVCVCVLQQRHHHHQQQHQHHHHNHNNNSKNNMSCKCRAVRL